MDIFCTKQKINHLSDNICLLSKILKLGNRKKYTEQFTFKKIPMCLTFFLRVVSSDAGASY